MTLILEDVNDDFAKLLKQMSKMFGAKIIKQNTKAEEWKKEAKQLKKEYKEGKLKSFDNIKDLKKDLLE